MPARQGISDGTDRHYKRNSYDIQRIHGARKGGYRRHSKNRTPEHSRNPGTGDRPNSRQIPSKNTHGTNRRTPEICSHEERTDYRHRETRTTSDRRRDMAQVPAYCLYRHTNSRTQIRIRTQKIFPVTIGPAQPKTFPMLKFLIRIQEIFNTQNEAPLLAQVP